MQEGLHKSYVKLCHFIKELEPLQTYVSAESITGYCGMAMHPNQSTDSISLKDPGEHSRKLRRIHLKLRELIHS